MVEFLKYVFFHFTAMISLPRGSATMNRTPTIPFDPFDPQFKRDAHVWYAQLRPEHPIVKAQIHGGLEEVWLVTRYAETLELLRDERLVKNRRSIMTPTELEQFQRQPAAMQLIHDQMLYVDPPDHRRLRQWVEQGFTPRRVAALEPRVRAHAHALLDAAQAKGSLELISDYALPLTLGVLADLMGLPEVDHLRLRGWVETLMVNIGRLSGRPLLRVAKALEEFSAYMRELYAEKRQNPTDDLTSSLVQTQDQEGGLTEAELLAMSYLLVSAGFETTVNLLGNSVLALLERDGQWGFLQQNRETLPLALEELLRFEGSVETSTPRYAALDFEYGGVKFARGDTVILVLSAANRDPAQFAGAETLELDRFADKTNKHLAFGHGIHYCLGAPLARMEAKVALDVLLERCPHLALAQDSQTLTWKVGMLMRGLERLPLVL
jgi:cytochrome P450